MGILEVTIRIISAFFVLLLMTRLMGRKEISQLTFFNFVSAIAIGSITGTVVLTPTLNLGIGLYTLAGWSALTILMGVIDIKSKTARKVLEGQPVIVIKQGEIMEEALRHVRLDIDALNTLLREKNVFSIQDVDYAIFETDGQLSVMKKENQQPATKSDINTPKTVYQYKLPTEVITDGTVNTANLKALNLTMDWLNQQLKQAGVTSISEVFYAEVGKDGALYIDNQQDSIH